MKEGPAHSSRERSAIATGMIILVLVVIIAVAGVGTYVFVFTGHSGQVGTGTTTSTVVEGTTTPGSSTVTTETVSVPTTSTSGTQGYHNYKGNFTFTVPLGPSGINDSNGKLLQWNSTQTATGTFTFFVNPATYIGSGSGQGTITVATRGYCTGTAVVPYTFTITATHPPGANLQVGFENPIPANVTVQLTCQGSTAGFYTANNPVGYIPVYPNLLLIASFPSTSSQPPQHGISYTVSIEQVS